MIKAICIDQRDIVRRVRLASKLNTWRDQELIAVRPQYVLIALKVSVGLSRRFCIGE